MNYTPATAHVTTGYGPAYAPPTQAPYAPAYGANGIQTPQPTGTPPSPPTAPAAPGSGGGKRPGIGRLAAIAAAILVAGLLGAVVGAIVTQRTTPTAAPADQTPATPTYSAETIRTQNIQLCTSYAIINSALPKPQSNALEVLPAVNGLRLALSENPAASTEIRSAITDVVHNYDALIGAFGKVRERGLAQPPTYDLDAAQRILDRAWDVCQLG